jgi:hypothetical protein
MPNIAVVEDLLFVAGGISVIVAFFLLLWLYGRVASKTRRSAPSIPTASLTEMAILFQTMRGVVHEQKALAREFNESVDRKVKLIREVTGKVLAEHERLCTAYQDLARKLNRLNQDLDGIRSQLAGFREGIALQGATTPSPVPIAGPEPVRRAANAVTQEPLPLCAIAMPQAARDLDDLIDNWVGLEFVGEDSITEVLDTPAAAAESEEDAQAARQAMQALLHMNPPETPAQPPERTTADSGNGRNRAAPLRQRVFRYHDAGMSIAQIAQELGIGKGEVRLMLSLREKDKRG